MELTLYQLKQVFLVEGILKRMSRREATEIYFVKALLPDEFLEDRYGLTSTFSNYTDGHNPTRNKIFNGKNRIGESRQNQIIAIFSNNPRAWSAYVKKCHELTASSSCQHDQLKEYLLSIFNNLEKHELSEKLCQQIRKACSDYQEWAVATSVLYVLMEGNISFLEVLSQQPISSPNESDLSYVNNSICFLRKSIEPLLQADNTLFQHFWELYSNMFDTIATVSYNGPFPPKSSLLDQLYQVITSNVTPRILHVEGPSGSDKNALLQLLFLKMYREVLENPVEGAYAPFYISLNHFEKEQYASYVSESSSEGEISRRYADLFEKELHPFKSFCNQNPLRKPIVFIDGIRNYKLGVPLDNILSQCLSSIKRLSYVIGVDIGLTGDVPRKRNYAALLGTRYFCTVKLSSLGLHQKSISMKFLENFCRIYNFSTCGLYEKLVNLSFYTVDAYQLRVLYPLLETSPSSIGQLYDAYCERYFFEDAQKIDDAARAAYQFTYTDNPIPLNKYYTDNAWLLMRRHASFIDYFIARYYVRYLLPKAQKEHDFDGINIVFPKSITRFIISLINRDALLETNIVKFTENHYYDLGTRAKSEMTYWLGRICHNRPRNKAQALLNKLYSDSCDFLLKINPAEIVSPESKEALFLHRGIAVSLIYFNQQGISDKYIQSLIQNPIAAEINRGFHLEYYGDIAYLPTVDSLNYSDDLQAGEKTLTQLFLICENSLNSRTPHPALELNLFTICSLIQARVGQVDIQTEFDLRPHICNMVKLLQLWGKRSTSEPIRDYFSMMLDDGQSILAQTNSTFYPVQAELYNYYSALKDYPRSGWASHKIPAPESISTHMYNCWMMAFLLLPDTTSEDKYYSKDTVMKMLLIHDLAERTTGDIEHPIKALDWRKYQEEEKAAMSKLFLKGTYPAIGAMQEEHQLWHEWLSLENFNAKLAKDIDRIQAIYQLCEYLLTYRCHFTEEKIQQWVKEYYNLFTLLGKSLFRSIISENNKFAVLNLNEIITL